MEYRALRPDEIPLLRQAEEYCFFASPQDYDPFVQHRLRAEDTRAIIGADRSLKAGMINFPFKVYMGGAQLAMGGIAGVVSWPETRREGHVADMLVRSVAEMKELGWPLSGLYPFKQSFYRRYGWEVAAAWVMQELPVEQLAPYRGSAGVVRRLAPGEADWRVLERLYAARFAGGYGYIVRETQHFWENWVNPLWTRWGSPWHTALWAPAAGAEPEGYLLYRFDKGDDGERYMAIKELVGLTRQAETGLWGFVAQHDSQAKTARIRTPRDYPLWHLVENSRDVKSTLNGGWMLRLVDVKSAFEARPWHQAPGGRLTIAVQDGHAPWNEGTWQLTFENARATLSQVPGSIADLSASVTTWAQIYAGFLRPDQAVATGRLSCTRREALDLLSRAIYGQEMWFYEYF